MKASTKNLATPFRTHKGKNYWRIFSLILLIIFIMLSLISFKSYGLLFLPLLLASLFGIISIRFPKIRLFDDRFEIKKEGLLEKFSDYHSFKYDEVENVEFSKGFTDYKYLIVIALLGSGGSGGNSKADQMIIKLKNDKVHVFNRFGKRAKFMKTIKLINSKLKHKDTFIDEMQT